MSGYERTFSVSVPVERAWRAFTDPDEIEIWMAEKFDADTQRQEGVAATPGGPVRFAVTEYVENQRLGYRQWAASPDTGIEVTVVFESIDAGTRITMTQAGFGDGSVLESDGVRRGMDESLADLVLYLEHGVRFARHRDVTARCSLGAELSEIPGAVRVDSVTEHEFADAAGLQPGDLVLQLGGGPVFDLTDVAFFLREHQEQERADVVFARGGDVHRSHAQLAPVELPKFATAR
jgi:uncharacterized protein YndB with AHSA1/START domain